MNIQDRVLISPDLTNNDSWVEGRVIEIEDNSFVGCVITVQTASGEIYFGKKDQFKYLN